MERGPETPGSCQGAQTGSALHQAPGVGGGGEGPGRPGHHWLWPVTTAVGVPSMGQALPMLQPTVFTCSP